MWNVPNILKFKKPEVESKEIGLGGLRFLILEIGLSILFIDCFFICPPSIDKNEGQKPLAQL